MSDASIFMINELIDRLNRQDEKLDELDQQNRRIKAAILSICKTDEALYYRISAILELGIGIYGDE